MSLPPAVAAQEAETARPTIRIGVLAKRGESQATAMWEPTASYLSAKVSGYEFRIVPYDFEQIYRAVEKGEVAFVIANSGMYVDFETRYGATRIATLKNLQQGKPFLVFGGVIFCRADRGDLNGLKDLK